jgi:DNA-binding transcriptional LysR family regulator
MLADAAGFALFVLRECPVTATQRGQSLLGEARQLLTLLDKVNA